MPVRVAGPLVGVAGAVRDRLLHGAPTCETSRGPRTSTYAPRWTRPMPFKTDWRGVMKYVGVGADITVPPAHPKAREAAGPKVTGWAVVGD